MGNNVWSICLNVIRLGHAALQFQSLDVVLEFTIGEGLVA